MSKRRIVLSIITGLAVSTTAFALTLPNGEEVEELTGNARWGCEVLALLVSNERPAVAEVSSSHRQIVPEVPLQRRHPCKFPKCPQAGPGNEASARVTTTIPAFIR